MRFLEVLKDFLTYKEPSKVDQFELLEDDRESSGLIPQDHHEDAGHKDEQDRVFIKSEPKKPKKQVPLNIDKWNEERKRETESQDQEGLEQDDSISTELEQNLKRIEQEFNIPKNGNIITRNLSIAQTTKAFIVYINGMVDRITLNDFILRPLMTAEPFQNPQDESIIDDISTNILWTDDITKETTYNEIISGVLEGLTALFIEGFDTCLLIETRGFEKRSVDKPITESVISGPHEGFTENLQTNLTLLRRIIKNKKLITEMLPIGKTNNSTCAVMYIDRIANNKVIEEVKRRIESLDIDFILGHGMLNQLIEDHPFALFPQISTTERPDRTASSLMEGKVAIICDGSPYASVVPATFFHMIHSAEDFSLRWPFATFLRFIRLIGFGLAVLLPGFYLALTLFHPQMIPTELVLAIEKSRENVPFPAIAEILMMEISFELIREAGIRVPDVIGQTLGIIGALILGESAVAANLVSPVLVIIVAVTGIGSFAIPNYSLGLAVRILKFIFIFLGAIAGFYGLSIGIFIMAGYACNMKSFGVPFFSPIAPKTLANPDIIIRQPLWKQAIRSDPSNTLNRIRVGSVVRGWANKDKRGKKNDR